MGGFSENDLNTADRVEIEYFTDPLCCWSWAFEPHWRKFINEYGEIIEWRYRMGVMLTDWNSYSDPMNDVSKPAQMAPLWLQAKYTTHALIDPDIWIEDPPQSSLPACMAVKCAEIQSKAAADVLLISLRKAVMTQKRNIAKREVISELAKELEMKYGILKFDKFEDDFENNRAIQQLKADMQKAKLADIGRFPTITMRLPNRNKGIMLVGYRPFSALTEAFKQLTDTLEYHI
jgi:predicted DsbA family dithiol-disulfide isomerase